MTEDRVARWLDDLRRTLTDAESLVARGRGQFDRDIAMALAFEALCNRVGDLAKKLVSADPIRFSEAIWSNAARNRDFIVHQYHRVDADLLWNTVAVEFRELSRLVG